MQISLSLLSSARDGSQVLGHVRQASFYKLSYTRSPGDLALLGQGGVAFFFPKQNFGWPMILVSGSQ